MNFLTFTLLLAFVLIVSAQWWGHHHHHHHSHSHSHSHSHEHHHHGHGGYGGGGFGGGGFGGGFPYQFNRPYGGGWGKR
ncbi:hypothetical protein GCK32_020039 [Trichostrongylus colubriformis]|uniref:Uncharacterized protein n=1 Tax=Trichostrongylus colubriformis TaxID=6319 RepID=A0AAN8FLW7_TRICO